MFHCRLILWLIYEYFPLLCFCVAAKGLKLLLLSKIVWLCFNEHLLQGWLRNEFLNKIMPVRFYGWTVINLFGVEQRTIHCICNSLQDGKYLLVSKNTSPVNFIFATRSALLAGAPDVLVIPKNVSVMSGWFNPPIHHGPTVLLTCCNVFSYSGPTVTCLSNPVAKTVLTTALMAKAILWCHFVIVSFGSQLQLNIRNSVYQKMPEGISLKFYYFCIKAQSWSSIFASMGVVFRKAQVLGLFCGIRCDCLGDFFQFCATNFLLQVFTGTFHEKWFQGLLTQRLNVSTIG